MEHHSALLFVLFLNLCLSKTILTADTSEKGDTADTSEKEDSIDINGDYIMNLGNQYNFSQLQLIGKVYKNFENNMSKALKEARIEFFLEQICKTRECEAWSVWSECSAEKGFFGMKTRSRYCGRNISLCTFDVEKMRVETESVVCLSKRSSYSGDEVPSFSGVFPVQTTKSDSKTTLAPHLACPQDYDFIDGHCLKLVVTFRYQHSVAKLLCQWDGGDLINVDNTKTQQALYTLLSDRDFEESVWIDGKRPGAADAFEYTNGFQPEFDNWYPGEPSVFVTGPGGAITKEACKVDTWNFGRGWKAIPCDTKLYFVCEHPVMVDY